MSYEQAYTFLGDKWHAVGWSEHTQCGLVIPMGNGYGDLPDGKKAHCGPAPEEVAEASGEPEPKAKK